MDMKKIDILPELNTVDRKKLDKFDDFLAKLMFYRGVKNNDEARVFLNSDYESGIHDPFLMKDLEKSVGKILEAIKENKKICIFSDYDADGVPGAVVINDFFKKIGFENFFVYIPHRNLEGFGLNNIAIEEIKNKEANLIITIDCGVADIDQVNLINKLGMEVIITDHHEIAHGMPDAFAVVDPKRPDCNYPFKELCGSGVIFKVIQGLIKRGDFHKKNNLPIGFEKWLLDMVGLATLSDMVPLVDENRIFAKYGLVVLRKSSRPGLLEIFKKNRILASNLTEEDVVFGLTPKINAASRMGHPDEAFKMLSTTDETEAIETVKYLETINQERKGVVAGMVKQINKHIKEELQTNEELQNKIIVKGDIKWSPSLLGLAASSIAEKYNCPVFLWGRGEGSELKGSCRGDGLASVVSIMENIEEGILATYGGHVMAGGFVLNYDKVDFLEEALLKSYEKIANQINDDLQKKIDYELKLSEVNWKLYDEVKKLAPFGVGNPKPLFLFKNLKIAEIVWFGKTNNHIKIYFEVESVNQNPEIKRVDSEVKIYPKKSNIYLLKFFADNDEKISKLKIGDRISFCGNLEKSNFAGNIELRINLNEIF